MSAPPAPPPTPRLDGQVAVVTGTSRGIGKAIADALAREGARVAGCALHGPGEPAATPGGFFTTCDVRRADQVEAFRDQVLAQLGPPDILVNNAGIVVRAALVDLTEQDWNDVLGANLHGTFLVTRAFLPSMMGKGPGGRIINIASISGRQGTAMLTAYCTAKHGVVGLTRALAEELRPQGIVVNAICPGSVDTDMLKIGMPGGTARMTPDDVARAALFLAADAPPALTGSCIDVFG
jgi:NAD(P)-dependent dehydrogenase (short-subunit alcohol dehydrogenase family)